MTADTRCMCSTSSWWISLTCRFACKEIGVVSYWILEPVKPTNHKTEIIPQIFTASAICYCVCVCVCVCDFEDNLWFYTLTHTRLYVSIKFVASFPGCFSELYTSNRKSRQTPQEREQQTRLLFFHPLPHFLSSIVHVLIKWDVT